MPAMTPTRRSFLAGAAALATTSSLDAAAPPSITFVDKTQLDQILDAPVLHLDFLKEPVIVDQDARNLESLLWDVYRFNSNYKYQGLSLFDGVASMEMALLELMAQTAQRPLADFFGGRLRTDIPIYVASGVRGNKPEEEI